MIGYRHVILNSKTVNVGDVRIMVVTDIHMKAGVEDLPEAEGSINISLSRYYYASPNLMEQFVAEVNTQNPDVVLCLGDMCDLPEYFVRWNEIWADINPGIRKYIVPGNHDLDDLTFSELLTTLGMENDPVVAGSQFNKVVELNDNALLILCDVTFDASNNHVNTYQNMRMHSTAPAWIAATLANYTQNNVIIALHCAPQVLEYYQTQSTQLYAIIDAAKVVNPALNVTWICGHFHLEVLQIDNTTHANSTALIMPAMILWENGRYVSMTVNTGVVYNQYFLDYAYGTPVLPFVMNIDTTKGDGLSQFKFPFALGSSILHDMMIDHGDGNFSFVHGTAANLGTATLIHHYAAPGIYTMKIYGRCDMLYFNNTGDKLKPVGEIQWGHIKIKSLQNSFYGCLNMNIPNGPITGCELVTNLSTCFRGSGITNIHADILSLMPLLVSVSSWLYGVTGYIGPIPGTLYANNPLITTLHSAMRGMTGLTGPIPGNLHQSLPNLTDITNEFYGDTGLTAIGSGIYDNNPLLTTAQGTFQNCSGLRSNIPYRIFYYCPLITNYAGTFNGIRNMVVDEMFDITALHRVTNWSAFLYSTATSYSCTGTIQEIWDIADGGDVDYDVAPTVTTALRNQIGLSNYPAAPTTWKS